MQRSRSPIALGKLRNDWGETRIPLISPERAPNMAPLDGFRITDPTVMRELATGRRLIPIDAFDEFTAPADPRRKRKDRWASA